MEWYIPVALRVLVANGLAQGFMKHVSGLPSRKKLFALQFGFCALFVVGLATLTNHIALDATALIILAIGFFNGFAAYFHWKAIDISLSKTHLFMFWDDVIAMGLTYWLLGEGKFLNAGIWTGIGLSVAAVVSLIFYSYWKETHEKKKTEQKKDTIALFLYVMAFSVIWGCAMFSMKYFTVEGVAIEKFLVSWYVGAFLAALIVLAIYPEKKVAGDVEQGSLTLAGVGKAALLAAFILSALGLTYWSLSLAPLIVVQPFFLIGEMILPALIGLYIFKERKDMDVFEKTFFALGIIGGFLVVFYF